MWVAAWLVSVRIAAAAEASLDEAFRDLAGYAWGQSRAALAVIDRHVAAAHGDSVMRGELESRLTAVLRDADATRGAKDYACRTLSVIGSATCVPAVAALLEAEDLSDMARFALERLPSPAAGAALHDALPRTTGALRAGVICSLAVRGEAESVPRLVPLLDDPDPRIATAAVRALGMIATPEAAEALVALAPGGGPLRDAAVRASLDAADRLLRAGRHDPAAAVYARLDISPMPAAIRPALLEGLVRTRPAEAVTRVLDAMTDADNRIRSVAVRLVRELPGEEATRQLAARLPALPVAGQVGLLCGLAARGDRAARPAVLTALESPDEEVRIAALRALVALGDVGDVAGLAELAATQAGPEGQAARETLRRRPGAGIDAAIAEAAKHAGRSARLELIRSLGPRCAAGSVPALLACATDPDEDVQCAALDQLAVLAGVSEAAALVDAVTAGAGRRARKAAEAALSAVCERTGAPCADAVLAGMQGADCEAQCALLRALGRAGGPKALDGVRSALRESDEQVREAAVRVLARWPDVSAAPDLLDVASTSRKLKLHVFALRGYVELVAAAGEDEAPEQLRAAVGLARRLDEQKLALSRLRAFRSVAAMNAAAACMEDEELADAAAQTALSIAGRLDTDDAETRAAVVAVLRRVLREAGDGGILAEARALLARHAPAGGR